MDPPDSVDRVRRRIISAIVDGLDFKSGLSRLRLSDVTPELWAQMPGPIARELSSRIAVDLNLDPLAGTSVQGACVILPVIH